MEFIGSNYPQVKGISPTDSSRKHELHKPLDKIIITLYIEKPFTRQNSPHSKVFGFKFRILNSGFKISGDMTKPRSFHFGLVLWMPEVFLSLSDGILRSGERNLWYSPLSSLRTPVQCDAVSYSQSQILTLAIRLVPGTCQF